MGTSNLKKDLGWKTLSIAALVVAVLAVGLVYTGTVVTTPTSDTEYVAEIESLNQQLEQTSAELDALRSEVAQIKTAEPEEHDQEAQPVVSRVTFERMASMAAVHVAYIDTRNKLNELQQALMGNDEQGAHEAFEQLEITLAHVTWPDVLQPHIGAFEESLDAVHHPLVDGELTEANANLRDTYSAFHDLDGAFYNTYLPTTMPLTPTLEIELTTVLPVFVGPDAQDNPTIQVKAGDVLKVTIVNDDAIEHDFVIDGLGVHSAHIRGKGDSTTVIFKTENPGVYEYYCSIPGHREAGMQGQIVVTAS